MSSSKAKPSEKSTSYHHGDLRRALIDAARASLKERGIDKLSLRGVARDVGVSHAAAYHHFEDKTALVAAIAVTAFADLTSAVETAGNEAGDAVARLRTLAQAYVRFALEHPDEFRVMFSPQLRSDAVLTEVERAGRATYTLLVTALEALRVEGRLTTDDPERAAITVWALTHGLATLMLDGPLYRNAVSVAECEALVATSAEHVLTGLVRK